MPRSPRDRPEPPRVLRPYLFFGLELDWESGAEELVVDCPFCGREDHLSVNRDTGLGRCYACGEGSARGGFSPQTFMSLLWKVSDEATTDYRPLAVERRVRPETLIQWRVCRSSITREWLVPSFGVDGKLAQLYRWVTRYDRRALLSSPRVSERDARGLFGRDLLSPEATRIYVCEGPWDSMALWQSIRAVKAADEGLTLTANVGTSLGAEAGVLGVPGSSSFTEEWLPLFEGKDVALMFDSDHPTSNPKTGRLSPPAGYAGMRRAAAMLRSTAASVCYLSWGDEGWDENKPSGYDVRDHLTYGGRDAKGT